MVEGTRIEGYTILVAYAVVFTLFTILGAMGFKLLKNGYDEEVAMTFMGVSIVLNLFTLVMFGIAFASIMTRIISPEFHILQNLILNIG